jgi:hypothetical protein
LSEHSVVGEKPVLDAALAKLEAIDPQSLTDDELHALVVQQQALASRMAAVRASFVSEWDRRRLWADDGSKAAWSRLSRECALSPQTARSEVLRAKKLRSMSATAAAFVDGKLSTDQVDLLTFACQPDIAHLLERDEQLLLGELPGLRYRDARRFIDYWIEQAFEEAGRERSRPDPAGRHVTVTRGFNGHFDLTPSRPAPRSPTNSRRSNKTSSKPTGRRPAPNTVVTCCRRSCLVPRGNVAMTPSHRWPATAELAAKASTGNRDR